jgi:hypothetical protein
LEFVNFMMKIFRIVCFVTILLYIELLQPQHSAQ